MSVFRPCRTDVDGAVCGVDVMVGAGRAILLAAELPSDVTLFGRALRRLGVSPGLELESDVPGVFATTTATADGERMLHLANITGHHTSVRIGLDGRPLGTGDGTLRVPPRTGAFLALGLDTPLGRLEWANAELTAVEDDHLAFGPPLGDQTVVVVTAAGDLEVDGGTATRDGDRLTVTARAGTPVVLRRP